MRAPGCRTCRRSKTSAQVVGIPRYLEKVRGAGVGALHGGRLAVAGDGAGGDGLTVVEGRLARDAQRVPMALDGAGVAPCQGEAAAPGDVFAAFGRWRRLIGVFVDIAGRTAVGNGAVDISGRRLKIAVI